MRGIRVRSSVLLVLLACSALYATVSLTSEEQAFLDADPVVRLAVDPDWYPYERLTKDGRYEGIASDLINLIGARTGIVFEVVPTTSWSQSIALAKGGQVDALAFLNYSEDRSAYLQFTEPYFIDPNVIITREEHPYIANPANLGSESVALPEGTSVSEYLAKEYPKLRQVLVESEADAVRLVNTLKADMTVRSLTMAAYVIKEEGHFNLKIAGQFPDLDNHLRMGVVKDDDLLVAILNKGIATLTGEEVERIVNSYISIKVQQGFNYRVFMLIAIPFIAVLLLVILFLRQSHSLNKKLANQRDHLVTLSKKLRQSENLYASMLKASPDAIVISSLDGTIIMASQIALTLVGEDRKGSLVGRNLLEFVHPDHHERLQQNLQRLKAEQKPGSSEYLGLRKDGATFNLEANSELIRSYDGSAKRLVSIVRDATERKLIERELKESEQSMRTLAERLRALNAELLAASMMDPLTKLKNRTSFDQSIGQAKARSDVRGTSFSLLIIDLDHFKQVNDTYGHAVGDKVIISMAHAMQTAIGEHDIVARWGGEEFVVLLDEGQKDAAVRKAQMLCDTLKHIAPEPVARVTVSIGVALYRVGERVEDLFKRCDDALYRAKHLGRDRVQFETDSTLVPVLHSGIEVLDEEHRALTVLVCDLLRHVFNKKDADTLIVALTQFEEKLKRHFDHEQALFTRLSFEGKKAHEEGHGRVLSLLSAIQHRLFAKEVLSDEMWYTLLSEHVLGYLMREDEQVLKEVRKSQNSD